MSLNELERTCLEAFRSGQDRGFRQGGATTDEWIAFGLDTLLHAGHLVRTARLADSTDVVYKSDGSPVTLLEGSIERHLRERLRTFAPEAVVVGEETGGVLPESGIAVAIDPVDGTWAFLSRTEALATVLAVFRDGDPFLGMVGNPATGEIGYASGELDARLLQLSLFGEDDVATTLPMTRQDSGATLVSVQPGRSTAPVVAGLYEAWQSNKIRFVRSPGGSPSWALLEAAKGNYVYVNMWGKRQAQAFDLAAGVLLVEGAGGQVTNLDGKSIDPVHHEGTFVAAVDDTSRQEVIEIVREVDG